MERTVTFEIGGEIAFKVSNFIYTKGDILESGADAIVIPVNIIGVAGAGLAKQWADKFPDALRKYKEICDMNKFEPGKVLILNDDDMGKKFILFPTKLIPSLPSSLKLIDDGLWTMRWILEKYPMESVAIPKLGCGLGRLRWKDVHKLITRVLEGTETTFYLYGQPV